MITKLILISFTIFIHFFILTLVPLNTIVTMMHFSLDTFVIFVFFVIYNFLFDFLVGTVLSGTIESRETKNV